MARRKKPEEHMNHERWLVSYADFITLLFAFFTSLYAISTVDAKKAGKMVFSTRAAFNPDFFGSDKPVLGVASPVESVNLAGAKIIKDNTRPDKPGANAPPQKSSEPSILDKKSINDFYKHISILRDAGQLPGVDVRIGKDGMILSLQEAAFFEPGTVQIKKKSIPTLDIILEKVIQTRLDLRVEGHTDDTPIGKKGPYRNNWELSAARATTVVQHLIKEFTYDPERLSVAGYASYRPQNSAEGPLSRAKNRRVDLVLSSPHKRADFNSGVDDWEESIKDPNHVPATQMKIWGEQPPFLKNNELSPQEKILIHQADTAIRADKGIDKIDKVEGVQRQEEASKTSPEQGK